MTLPKKEGYVVFGCNYRGRGKSGTNNVMFELKADCEYNAKGPEIDWKNGMVNLLLVDSIAPIAYSSNDKRIGLK